MTGLMVTGVPVTGLSVGIFVTGFVLGLFVAGLPVGIFVTGFVVGLFVAGLPVGIIVTGFVVVGLPVGIFVTGFVVGLSVVGLAVPPGRAILHVQSLPPPCAQRESLHSTVALGVHRFFGTQEPSFPTHASTWGQVQVSQRISSWLMPVKKRSALEQS